MLGGRGTYYALKIVPGTRSPALSPHWVVLRPYGRALLTVPLPCPAGCYFGVKYFLLTSAAMVLVLVVSQEVPGVRQWRFLYGYITIVVVLNEKVRGRRSARALIPLVGRHSGCERP